jgi:cell wall assembly regulator SMI1
VGHGSTDARPLDSELLDALFSRWTDQGAPILDHLQPGLSEAAMNAIVASLGLALPVEARLWWGWHNGVGATAELFRDEAIGPVASFLSLEKAVDWYRQELAMAATVATTHGRDVPGHPELADPAYWWEPTWLPILMPVSGMVACDCSDPTGTTTGLRLRCVAVRRDGGDLGVPAGAPRSGRGADLAGLRPQAGVGASGRTPKSPA